MSRYKQESWGQRARHGVEERVLGICRGLSLRSPRADCVTGSPHVPLGTLAFMLSVPPEQ